MENNIMENPWKGLKFYTEGEVLYGRNAEIQSLSQYIFNNTQTVLYGQSGIGKSSILNAGIFPKARQAGMIPVSIRLKHENENNYLQQIRAEIQKGGLTMKEILPAINGEEGETLWEFMHRHIFYDKDEKKCVPLLVFDQFEEIFTLQSNEKIKREFFRQLGNLLNEVKPAYVVEHENKIRQEQSTQQETKVVSSGAFKGLSLKLNIKRNDDEQQNIVRYLERPDYHIVFAMREDFLSSLELYASSIPVMKDNRFGLLPINEEQAAEIIQKPCQGLVDKDVTKLIIQQVTGRDDFDLDGKPEIQVDAAVLSLFLSELFVKKPNAEPKITAELVNASSGHIIHDFYIKSITSDEEKNEILSQETILILEDQLLTREGRRNNISRNDLIVQGVTDEELKILIDKRKLLRQFHHGNDIRIEYIHDILCPVVKERKEQRAILLQQEQERKRQEEERALLLKRQRRERRRMIWLLAAAVSVILLFVGWWTYDWFFHEREFKTYYADFTRKNGWPVGVGEEMSESKAKELTTFYCLVKYGYSTENYEKVLISPGKVISPHNMRVPMVDTNDTTDVRAREFAALLRQTRTITFSKGEGNRVAKETAHDNNGNVLYTTNYYGDGQIHWVTYNNANGSPIRLRGEADRMRVVMDSLGMNIEYMFFDAQGIPCRNDKGDYGIAMQYDEKNRITELRHLDAFRNAKYTEKRTYTDSRNYTIAYQQSPFPYNGIDVKFDAKGNIVERCYHYAKGMNRPAFESIEYSAEGLMTKRQWLDGNHKPFKGGKNETGLITYLYKKGSKDLCEEIRYNANGDTVFAFTLKTTETQRDSIVHNYVTGNYIHKHEKYDKGSLTEVAFYAADGAAVYNAVSQFHKLTQKTVREKDGGKIVYITFYDEHNELYKVDATRTETHYDAMNNRTLFRSYDYKGNIIKSMAYEYENGVEKTRYVVGVHGTPIRCPKWETEGLCYYKLHSVRDFTNNLAQLHAVGENGVESLLYGASSYEDAVQRTRNIGCGWTFYTIRRIAPYSPVATDVAMTYAHLLKKDGAADKAGLRDGDILISGTLMPGNSITVKRYDVTMRKTTVHNIQLPKVNNLEAEAYTVYFTKEEYEALWK